DWYGEGDDMIFIDDDLSASFDAVAWAAVSVNAREESKSPLAEQLRWPPTLHGTGTEDWNHCAFCPTQEFHAPSHGVLLYTGDERWKWHGKQSIYRYHIQDPIRFRRCILFSIEHG